MLTTPRKERNIFFFSFRTLKQLSFLGHSVSFSPWNSSIRNTDSSAIGVLEYRISGGSPLRYCDDKANLDVVRDLVYAGV